MVVVKISYILTYDSFYIHMRSYLIYAYFADLKKMEAQVYLIKVTQHTQTVPLFF